MQEIAQGCVSSAVPSFQLQLADQSCHQQNLQLVRLSRLAELRPCLFPEITDRSGFFPCSQAFNEIMPPVRPLAQSTALFLSR